ncbi:DNA primase TraC [Rickettsiales bacterium Ac37b]|nr:DNA primase TraC [Rickettsiales bacterium Ac37b]
MSRGIKERFIFNNEALSDQQKTLINTKLTEVEAKRQELQLEVAEEALELWNNLSDNGISPYLEKKQVESFGIKFDKDNIIYIPLYDIAGKLCSLQKIYPSGSKQFLAGGRKQACFHIIGKIVRGEVLYIAEGYATAATLHMATNKPVVIAFDTGNIEPVVAAIRIKYPKKGIYDFPKINPIIGAISSNPDDIASVVARKTGNTIFPSGAMAANLLGFSTQVPAKAMYLTNGASKHKKVGNRTIILKHARIPIVDNISFEANLALQALAYMGKNNIDNNLLQICASKLSKEDIKSLNKIVTLIPAWMVNAVYRLQDNING